MIDISENPLHLDQINHIIFSNKKISINNETRDKIIKNFNFIREFSKNKIIYGINTGLGPMTQYRINKHDQKELQYNLIRSHSSGAGNPLPGNYVKAAMLARVNSLIQGYSGINIDAIDLLIELINHNVYPYIPEHGGVGASGDLVQLSHLALIMIGEGDVFFKGELQKTGVVFKELNLNPLSLQLREGLALINGTSVMTGIGTINLIYAKILINWMIVASAMINEIVASYDDHFSTELNQVKLHKGQNSIAQCMRSLLSTSKRIRKRSEHLYEKNITDRVLDGKVQEYYSIRCVPQILGPIYDTIKYAEDIIINELNSVNDNPVIDDFNNDVFHGGNFHGDYVSFEMDKIKIAITKLSMLSERQINYLMFDKLNHILPPFINLGTLGLNLGMQGVQFTAVSTTAENQALSNPMYVHSIPNNNDNQDIVSMGTNAALITKKVIDNSFEVLAIEFMSLLQAISYLKIEKKLSDFTRNIHLLIRKIFPQFVEDQTKYQDIQKIKEYLMENNPKIID